MMNSVKSIAAALALGFVASSAHANLLVNGGFEELGTGCYGNTTSLAGWAVTSGNIDHGPTACWGITAGEGDYLVDLLGWGSAGTISQSFATEAGASYSLGFLFGGNAAWQYASWLNDSAIKSLSVRVDGDIVGIYDIDTTGLARHDAGWRQESLIFTATSASTTLSFASLNLVGAYGPMLDNVVVEKVSVPEPGTLALMGLGMLGLGLARKRRPAHG
jgi:choice-of-anchor C domain-containing protein